MEPNTYSLAYFNNSSLINEALKELCQAETQQDAYAWQNQLFALLIKELLGSLAWCYGLCLLSQKVMQKARQDRLQERHQWYEICGSGLDFVMLTSQEEVLFQYYN